MPRKTLRIKGSRRRGAPEPEAPPPPSWAAERAEMQATIDRLNDMVASISQTRGLEAPTESIGVGGHQAVERVRDWDWPLFQKAVMRVPKVYASGGYEEVMTYIQTTLRVGIAAFTAAPPRTPDQARSRHRVLMMLSAGEAEALFFPGTAGWRARNEFLEQVAIHFVGPCIQFLYAHGSETPAGIAPIRG